MFRKALSDRLTGLTSLRVGVASIVLLTLTGAATVLSPPAAAACYGDTYVSGYFRGDGKYVSGHYRTCPDSSSFNNYSSQGNFNPYTGERGTRRYDSSYGSTCWSCGGWDWGR